MKRVLLMALGLVLVCASSAFAQKVKDKGIKVKNKDKRFETVVRPASEYVGRYSGPDAEHYIEVTLDASGNLSVAVFEGARRARLESIKLTDGSLTAAKVYDDGERATFTATFANRILNGTSLFGMVVDGPYRAAEGVTFNRLFYKRD